MAEPIPASLLCAMTIAFVLHNAEEALRIEDWANRRLRPSIAHWYSKAAFVIAVVLLSVAFAATAIWVVITGGLLGYRMLVLGWSAICANAALHAANVAISSDPMPGGWSAVLIILPLGYWSIHQALDHGLLSLHTVLMLFGIGALLQIPLALLAIAIGNGMIAVYKRRSTKNN